MANLIKKYKELILYLFFGVCTTIINIIVYYAVTRFIYHDTIISTILAWIASVLFAYITNKIFVFQSATCSTNTILKEFISFVCCRLLSGLMDLGIMYVCVDIIGLDDMIIKIISNVLVIIFNYVASKLIIFKK